MRKLLLHVLGLPIAVALYCLVVPQARRVVFGDAALADKLVHVGIVALCIYVCFLFVYFAFLRDTSEPAMSDDGAYGGYADDAKNDRGTPP